MYGQVRSWTARGLCIAHLLAHLLVHIVACVDLVVPIGSREAGYAKTCLGIVHIKRHHEIRAVKAGIAPIQVATQDRPVKSVIEPALRRLVAV